MLNVAATLCVGLAGWWVAKRLGMAAPAMLGSMIAVGVWSVLFGAAAIPQEVRVFAQGISGAFIAMSVRRSDLRNARKLLVPFLLLIVMLTLNTLVMGTVLFLFCDIDIYTALFSCVAGGVTDISMIAMDFDADAGEVALMQTARLVSVLLFFPSWIEFMCRNAEDDGGEAGEPGDCVAMPATVARLLSSSRRRTVFTVVLAFAMGGVGKWSGIPAGTMVFPLASVAALNLSVGCCHMPVGIKSLAQLLAGSLVGASITADTFSDVGHAVVPVVLLFLSYWLVNFVYARTCQRHRLLDVKSAMFASAPGGATDMALIAADLNADLAKIAAIQVLRAVYAVAVMPTVVLLFARLFF